MTDVTGEGAGLDWWMRFASFNLGAQMSISEVRAFLFRYGIRGREEDFRRWIEDHLLGAEEVGSRSRQSPIPRRVMVLGNFGSGKSSLVRHCIGTVGDQFAFPPVSPGKTTTAPTTITTQSPVNEVWVEFILLAQLQGQLGENAVEAARRIAEGAPRRTVMRALLDHRGQCLRLRQLLGPEPSLGHIIDELDRQVRALRVTQAHLSLDEASRLQSSPGFATAVADLESAVRRQVDHIVSDLPVGRDATGWPVCMSSRPVSRDALLQLLDVLVGVGGAESRALRRLTPVVARLAVNGDFAPKFCKTEPLTFVDTPGIGHDASRTRMEQNEEGVAGGVGSADPEFSRAGVLLVDTGLRPMSLSTLAVIEAAVNEGAVGRFHLAVTHMDQVLGGHVATFDDAKDHIWQSVSAGISSLEPRIGSARAEHLRDRLERKTYYLANLAGTLDPDNADDAETLRQLVDLLRSLAGVAD